MNKLALITMIISQGIVTAFTAYYFVKVLRTPPKPEPDSFTENEDVERQHREMAASVQVNGYRKKGLSGSCGYFIYCFGVQGFSFFFAGR